MREIALCPTHEERSIHEREGLGLTAVFRGSVEAMGLTVPSASRSENVNLC